MSDSSSGAVVLAFPPLWYYQSVPADLLYTGSELRARGVPTRCVDLSSGMFASLLASDPGYQALRRVPTYQHADMYVAAHTQLAQALAALSQRFGVRLDFQTLDFPDVDAAHIPSALTVGLDESRNPALAYLKSQVAGLLATDPVLIGIALVHPDQIVQVSVLGRLLREAGYGGFLALYGAHEDVLAPEDVAADLVTALDEGRPHLLFTDFDGVIVGEAETALFELREALCGRHPKDQVRSLLCPKWGLVKLPERGVEDLRRLAAPDFSLVDPAIYPFPRPVVDLRLSRGCPWNRCTFCAITAHQEGYRARATASVANDLESAHRSLRTSFFRFRDDLLTPKQLRDLSLLLRTLPFRPRFSVRARFEPGFTKEILAAAAEAGLEELWLGLESAVPRVRELMDKGSAQPVIERILGDAAACGIRVRALCIVGYPGETAAEVRETFQFLLRMEASLANVAMTPFQLMRRAPLGQHAERYGLRLLPDPVPTHERIRATLPATWDGALPAEEIRALVAELAEGLSEAHYQRSLGPSLTHAWLFASTQQAGWPGRTAILPVIGSAVGPGVKPGDQ